MTNVKLQLQTPIFASAASPAYVETLETYEDNISFYKERNFSFIPLPLEKKYVETESEEVKSISDGQLTHEDSHILQALWDLYDVPFLICMVYDWIKVEDGEIKRSYSPNSESRPFHNFIQENPEYKSKIKQKYNWEEHIYIFTLADVNKRVVKEGIYPIIGGVEELFSNSIKNEYPDDDQRKLLGDLSPETVGRWQKSIWEELPLHISEYMTLSEMIKIIGKNPEMREIFGYQSRNQFDNDVSGLVDLRNKIMHVSRSLVHDYDDLNTLINRIDRALDLLESSGAEIRIQWYKERYGGRQ